MRTSRFLLALSLVVIGHAFADDDLDKLKASYEAAVVKATAPIKATYEKELQKLLQQHTKAGKLDAATAVMGEMQRLGGAAPDSPAPAAGTPAAQPPGTPQVSERWFVNKTWSTPSGTHFNFEKNGVGNREFGKDKTTFVWVQDAGGLLKATGQVNKGGPMRTWFFRFASMSEGYYGDNKDNVGIKLDRK